MMKRIHVVLVKELDGKQYAVAEAFRSGENLLSLMKGNCTCCHLCESATQAHYIAEEWNESYKANGTSIFC